MKDTIYLLTGAAGFLGSNISRTLIANGKKVRALVLKGDPAIKFVPKEAEIILGDITDIKSLEKFFTVTENTEVIVIHSASIVTVSPDPNPKVYAVNVTGTQNIVDLCVAKKVKKLVYISSTGAITEQPKGQPICEPESFNPKDVVGYYSETKAMATQYVLDAVRQKGLDASIVYPSGICGPNDYAFGLVAGFIIQYCHGKMPAGIAGTFNSVDVRDLAIGVVDCCEMGHIGDGYIMSNDLVSMKDMFELISKASSAPQVKMILSIPVAKAMAAIFKLGSKITGKPAMVTNFEIYNLARNNNFDCSKAKKELGYHTRPFTETMTDSVVWLKAEHKIQ